MRTVIAACAAFATAGLSAAAQEYEEIGFYFTELGTVDMRNSRGVRLTTLGAILQQDRANYHRFGRSNAGDEGDRFFADRAARARIPELYARGPGEPLIERIVTGGEPLRVVVFVCGWGREPTFLVVEFADGDAQRGC
ncbi:MAG: hypothetical protein AAGE13_08535 [Pseudomonadota bacterium]